MKRLILSIIAITSVALSSYGQCTPDPQFTVSGIYPDSATGLPAAYVDAAYSEVITVVVPADTLAPNPAYIPGITPEFILVTIYDITLNSITGLPSMITYACNPSNCVFPGGQTECVSLYSTSNPTAGDVGVYPLVISTTTHTDVIDQNDDIDYYFIEVIDSGAVGISTFDDESFELKTIYPNPVTNNSKIQFISGTNTEVTFTITNLLGKKIVNKTISAKRGVNDIFVSAADFADGIYLYSISTNGKTSTKRMIVKK